MIKCNGKGTLWWKILFSLNDVCLWGRWNPSKKRKSYFLMGVFLISNSLNVDIYTYIFWVKWNYTVLWAFFSAVKFVFFKIYDMLIWMKYFKLLCLSKLLPLLCITICTTVRKFFNILLVVELLMYSKNISSFRRIKTIHLFKNP